MIRCIIAILLCVGSLATYAQGNGSIKGTATDENGEPIVHTVIEVYNSSKIKKGGTVTDTSGNYSIQDLQPGIYELKSRSQDYYGIHLTGINVLADTPVIRLLHFKPMPDKFTGGYQPPLITRPTTTESNNTSKVPEDKIKDCGGHPHPQRVTFLDGVMIRPADTPEKKKGFFNFLKRKKRENL